MDEARSVPGRTGSLNKLSKLAPGVFHRNPRTLPKFGIGVLGSAGFLLPSKADAFLRRHGSGHAHPLPQPACPMPEPFAGPVDGFGRATMRVHIGPNNAIIMSHPGASGATGQFATAVYGGGRFCSWGDTTDPTIAVTALDVLAADGTTLICNGQDIGDKLRSAVPGDTYWGFAFLSAMAQDTRFRLRFTYTTSGANPTPIMVPGFYKVAAADS